eukprot:1141950-Pelagomonas_calceolata.AAC.7
MYFATGHGIGWDLGMLQEGSSNRSWAIPGSNMHSSRVFVLLLLLGSLHFICCLLYHGLPQVGMHTLKDQ